MTSPKERDFKQMKLDELVQHENGILNMLGKKSEKGRHNGISQEEVHYLYMIVLV